MFTPPAPRRLGRVLLAGLVAALVSSTGAPALAADDIPPTSPTGLAARVSTTVDPDVAVDGEAGLGSPTSSRGATALASAARNGTAGVRVSSTAAAGYARWDGPTVVPVGSTHASVRAWVRLGSRAPGESVDLLTVSNSNGLRNFDFFVTGDTQRFKWDLFIADADEAAFTVEPGRWYLVEVQVSFAGTRHRATVRIDGVDQGTIESDGVPLTVAGVTIGTVAAKTASRDFDDLFAVFGTAPRGWLDAEGAATSVNLSWAPSVDVDPGVAEYQIWRNGSWYGWVPGGRTTWTDTAPLDGGRYTVRAVDGAGLRSGWSTAVVVDLDGADTVAPPTPTGLTATVEGASVRLRWNAVVDTGGSGLREYSIFRNGRWYGWVAAGTTTWLDAAPLAGATYRVGAIDNARNASPWSTEAVAGGGADTVAPPTPTGLSATAENGSVRLRWNGVVDTGGSGLREYSIFRDGRWYAWVPAGTTTWLDPAPRAGATYRVGALDNARNASPWSAPVA